MSAERALTPRQAERDALLSCAVATVCSLAFLALVALPIHADAVEDPGTLDDLSPLGFLVGALLAPLAAGLAAFVSGSVLRARKSTLTLRARRLHWSAIALSTALLVAFVGHAGALRTGLD
jgi:hypothetical protein